ncbi:MAG: hypothetical protein Q8Q12_15690, partial [bacterium]|nr:hypothetical protein [bacterium]
GGGGGGGGALGGGGFRVWGLGKSGFVNGRGLFSGPFFGVVGRVPVEVPVEEVLVGADEEGAGAAGGVEDAEARRLLGV